MKQGLYCVYDVKMNLYSMPYFSVSDPAAIRAFSDAVTQGDSLMSRHPEDFVLVHLGDVDDGTGVITTPVTPQEIFRGRDVQKEQSNVR